MSYFAHVITTEHLNSAVAVLNKSDRGRQAMRDALALLDNGGIGLDQSGQAALMLLIVAALDTHPGYARDAMRDAEEQS